MIDPHHNDSYEDTGEIVSGVAAVAYSDWEDTSVSCSFCGGEGIPLGSLGRRAWFRCRMCGIDFSTRADD